jgi:CelD/BcsL family acetyltransferase involved in cellulose biosynthesis
VATEVAELRSLAELAAVEGEWRALASRMGSPLNDYDWIHAAAGTLHAGKLAVITLRQHGRLVALAPFARVSALTGSALEFIGARVLAEPTDFLYESEAARAAICEALRARREALVCARLPPESAAALRDAPGEAGYSMATASAASPTLAIDRPWAEFEQGLSSRRRSDYRALRRKLEKRGRVEATFTTPGADAFDECFAEFMRVEDAGWKGRGGSALARREDLRGFFAAAGRAFAARGQLRYCRLAVDDVAVAAQLAIEYAERWWILKIGFDEAWSDYSPGLQLSWDTVRTAFGLKLRGVEFLGTAEAWLTIWTKSERNLANLRYYPRSFGGISRLTLDFAQRAALAAGARLRLRGDS